MVSAIGQADDVILASNSIDDLSLLARLTESYCARYRVKLVPSKTKLLPLYKKEHKILVEYAKLINPVTINGDTVNFVKEAEHVGVLRSVDGNMPNILQRIASHKRALGSVSSAGLARGHRANPAASLKAHQLYCTSVLFSGLSSLVLSKSELNVIEIHFKNTVQNIQRLHQNTPRSIVYFLAGSLPGEAVFHTKQLSLFSMISRLPQNPLHSHARYVLSSALPSARSWFQQIRDLCLQYNLPHPLQLLDCPLTKDGFKKLVKLKVLDYWQDLLRAEAASLPSLHYFRPQFHSLKSPHPVWKSAGSNPYESSKSSVLAQMISGRYRTEVLCKHWSDNRAGFCLAPTCCDIPGTLEHLLIECPALETTRKRLQLMWLSRSSQFPPLHHFIANLLTSPSPVQVQFILDPTTFPEMIHYHQYYGQPLIDHLLYLVRTFAYNIHRQKLILIGRWPGHNTKTLLKDKQTKKRPAFTPNDDKIRDNTDPKDLNEVTTNFVIAGIAATNLLPDPASYPDMSSLCAGTVGQGAGANITTKASLNKPNQQKKNGKSDSASTPLVPAMPDLVLGQGAAGISCVGWAGLCQGQQQSSSTHHNPPSGHLVHSSL